MRLLSDFAIADGKPIQKILYGSADLNYPSIPPGAEATQSIYVLGARSGDPVILGVPNYLPTNSAIVRYYANFNSVDIVLRNMNLIDAIDPSTGIFNVLVFKV